MSSNDQPPATPDEQPQTPGEQPQTPGEQPVTPDEGADTPPGPTPPAARRTGLVVVAVIAVLALIGGGVGVALLVSGDDDDADAAVSMSHFCDSLKPIDDANAYDQDGFLDAIDDAGTPEEMTDEVSEGRDVFIDLLHGSATEKEFGAAYLKLQGDQSKQLNAYFNWVSGKCFSGDDDGASSEPSPSVS